MGQAYTYRCNRCGFEKLLYEGHGFAIHPQSMDFYLKSGEKLFHHNTHRALTGLSKKHGNLFIDAGFKTYKCPKCNLLYNKIEVSVIDRENETENKKQLFKSEFRCTGCRSRLKLTNIHRLKAAVCPSCNKMSFRLNPDKMELWE